MSLYVEKYGHSMLGDAYGVRRPRDLQMALQGVWLDGDLCRLQGRRRAGGLAIRAGECRGSRPGARVGGPLRPVWPAPCS